MDLKDTNTKKCTQGLRRPFGVAGNDTLTPFTFIGVHLLYGCILEIISFPLLLASPLPPKINARQPIIPTLLVIKSK